MRTGEGWLSLAVVTGLWSRAVTGWPVSSRMTAQLACDALQMALWRRKHPENVIVHTDRGWPCSVYTHFSCANRQNVLCCNQPMNNNVGNTCDYPNKSVSTSNAG